MGAGNGAKAMIGTAIAIEGLVHFPFGGRIKKPKLIARFDRGFGDQGVICQVEEYIGIATVIEVFEMIRFEFKMLRFTDLNG
mgnify:FL=1|jgi:hypothetical protein